jgi:hypothetical protein
MTYGTLATDVVQSSTTGTPTQFNDGSGTQIGTLCRAWVNFNGTSGSVAIRTSFNVSSITRNAAGQYNVNFTNAMPDANFVVSGSATRPDRVQNEIFGIYGTQTTTYALVQIKNDGGTIEDSPEIGVAVFR